MINKKRQYGMTTTLKALVEYLKEDYFFIVFHMISTANFADLQIFMLKFGVFQSPQWLVDKLQK